jgi:phenylacetate-CoA ligase
MSLASDVEEIRKKLLADLRARMPQYVDRLTWPQEKLKEERERLLRELVRTAKEKSAWHRKRLQGVDPDTLREEDLPRSIPVMTKADLMENWDEIVTDRRLSLGLAEKHLEEHSKELSYPLDQFIVGSSGGSSGQRGIFVQDLKSSVEVALRAAPRFIRWYVSRFKINLPETQTVAYVGAGAAVHSTVAGYKTFSNPKTKYIVVDITRPLQEIIEELNRIQPTRLQGYPSALRILADEAKLGRLTINPALIVTEAEPLYPEIREAIESTWSDAPIFNAYGSSESNWIAISCGIKPGGTLHLNEDGVIVEPVASDGRPVKPGTRASKIYVTNLINTLLPLIRYEITDRITVLDGREGETGKCPCGCTFRRIADVQGRLEDVFVYQVGSDRGLSVDVDVFETPLNEYRNIVQYQVRQKPDGAEILIVSKGDVAVDKVRSDIKGGLEQIGLKNAAVSVKIVDGLERTRLGKAKRYVPLPTKKSN